MSRHPGAVAGRAPARTVAARPRLVPVVQRAGSLVFRAGLSLHVRGREHVPATGALLVAGNHSALLDGPLVFPCCRGRRPSWSRRSCGPAGSARRCRRWARSPSTGSGPTAPRCAAPARCSPPAVCWASSRRAAAAPVSSRPSATGIASLALASGAPVAPGCLPRVRRPRCRGGAGAAAAYPGRRRLRTTRPLVEVPTGPQHRAATAKSSRQAAEQARLRPVRPPGPRRTPALDPGGAGTMGSAAPAGRAGPRRPGRGGLRRRCRERWSAGPAGAGRRRPPQRRQVHAGQPHHRPPPGRRRGRAGRDPRPGPLRRPVERPPVHRRRHRRLGTRRPRPRRRHRRPGRDRRRRPPTWSSSSSTPRVGATDVDEAAVEDAAPQHKPVDPGRQQGRQPEHSNPKPPRCGRSGLGEPHPISALHGRGSGDLLDAILAALPPAPPIIEGGPRGPRRVALSAAPTSASPACSTGSPRRNARSSTRSPAPPSTRSTAWSRWTARSGSSSTPPACANGCNQACGTEYYASPAHRRRRRGRRGRRGAARRRRAASASRTSGSSPRSSRPAGRWSSPSTSGTWSTRTAGLPGQGNRPRLKRITWAPRVNISAKTGRAVDKLAPAIRRGLAGVGAADPHRPAQPVADGPDRRPPRTRSAGAGSRASCSPPRPAPAAPVRAVHHRALDAGYLRFIERKLREEFGFEGTPIEVSVKAREKRGRPS